MGTKIQVEEVAENTWFTGSLRMINRVKKLGYELETDKSDDEADAIGIMITYLDDKSLPVTHPIS